MYKGPKVRATAGGLPPERLAEVRRRLLDGAYDSLDVIDEVARRILARGDL